MEWPAELHTRERPSERARQPLVAQRFLALPKDHLMASSPPTSSTAKASRHHLAPLLPRASSTPDAYDNRLN